MSGIGTLYASDDWKKEKHVPVIEVQAGAIKADEVFAVKLSVGKEIAHPNTTAHHIRWIQLFFKPEGDKFAYQVGSFEFTAHGESVEGADAGPVFTNHAVTVELKLKKPGVLYATSLCNIHGLWESSQEIKLG